MRECRLGIRTEWGWELPNTNQLDLVMSRPLGVEPDPHYAPWPKTPPGACQCGGSLSVFHVRAEAFTLVSGISSCLDMTRNESAL